MKTSIAVVLGSLLFVITPAFCQNPNFSGVWKRGPTGNSMVYSIDHQDPIVNLSFKSQYQAGGLSGGLTGSETYSADGVEKHSGQHDGEAWTTVNWQGTSLVILRVVKAGYHVTVTRDAWSLSEDGQTLTRTKRIINMDGVTENVEVFHKQ